MASAYPTVAALHPTRSCGRGEAGHQINDAPQSLRDCFIPLTRRAPRRRVPAPGSRCATSSKPPTPPCERGVWASTSPKRRKSQPICVPIRISRNYGWNPDRPGINGVWQPFAGTQFTSSVSYLHERQHKRELRLESARESTAVAESHLLRSGAHPAVQPAQRFRPDLAGQGGAGQRAGQPGLLGSRTRGQPQPLSAPATSPRWTWTDWSCSACSSNRIRRPRW